MKNIGITVYGCDHDEAEALLEISPNLCVIPTIINAPVSELNIASACGNRCISVGHKSEISERVLHSLKDNGIEYISTRSMGYDHIDMQAALKIGIAVGNVEYSPNSVADYTVMLMLMAVRNAKAIISSASKYDFRLNSVRGKELSDMTIGVIGTGHIGKAVIKRLKGFGCRVLAYSNNSDAAAEYVTFNELLKKSDIITLHLPLTADTRHIIGCGQIKKMKQGAFIINTGRGALINTGSLTKALENKKLGGAALDVLEGEEGLFYFDCTQKPIDNMFLLQLQRMPNVIITPHTAYHTERALYDTIKKTIINCIDFERSLLHG